MASSQSEPIRIRLCVTCGILVFDPAAHDRFHVAMNLGPSLYDDREIALSGL